MKSITYVSTVIVNQTGMSVPIGLSQILRQSRNNNAKSEITGFLSYRSGRYIQVIEGTESQVNALYQTIRADTRHVRVRTVFDSAIAQRAFPGWNMKLLTSIKRQADVKRFIAHKREEISSLSETQKELLEHFYPLAELQLTDNNFAGKSLALLAWPESSVIQQSPIVVELCARLVGSPQPYNDLVKDPNLGSPETVNDLLRKFQTMDILNVTDNNQGSPISQDRSESTGFYLKMRKLLKIN